MHQTPVSITDAPAQKIPIDADVVPEASKMRTYASRSERAEGGGGSSSPKAKLRGPKAGLRQA